MKISFRKTYDYLIYMLFISLLLGRVNLYVGFSFKPYMFVTLLGLLFIPRCKFYKLLNYERLLLLFFLVFSLSALQFRYVESHIRFLFALIIIVIYYFISRSIITRVEIHSVENALTKSGLIGITASLMYYFFGAYKLGFSFYGNNINSYGLMIDRSIPRLTGLVSGDPNIYAFFVTPFLFYFATHLNSLRNKIGFAIVSISVLLTFSRGAFIAILIAGTISIYLEKKFSKKIKYFIVVLVLTATSLVLSDLLNFDFVQIILSRFTGIASDGGSGRINLWRYAFQTFLENPLGIGINSTLEYGLDNYGIANYLHNTFLEVLVESGIIGFLLYIIFWIVLLRRAYKLFNRYPNSKYLLISLIAMLIQTMFLSILYSESFYFVLILIYRYSVEEISLTKNPKY